MVKNTTGGSKHKSSARKHATPAHASRDPAPSSPFERIATVERLLGNGMCTVVTIESRPLTLICHIRGKFRGKQKSHNIVSYKSTLLVGLREWESIHTNCDLIAILGGNQTTHILNHDDNNNNNNTLPHDVIFDFNYNLPDLLNNQNDNQNDNQNHNHNHNDLDLDLDLDLDIDLDDI